MNRRSNNRGRNAKMGQIGPDGNPANTIQPSNPFDTYNAPFTQTMFDARSVIDASRVSGVQAEQARQANSNVDPIPVSLPPHLYIPADAQSIDIRNLVNVPANSSTTLLTFRGQRGGLVKFIGYGVFFDALMFDLIDLVPKVNGIRVFPFHGNPDRNFKIGLGTGADLSNSNLIPCQLDLQPSDILTWEFTNDDVVDVAAGVRMSGYYSQDTIRKTGRFGG